MFRPQPVSVDDRETVSRSLQSPRPHTVRTPWCSSGLGVFPNPPDTISEALSSVPSTGPPSTAVSPGNPPPTILLWLRDCSGTVLSPLPPTPTGYSDNGCGPLGSLTGPPHSRLSLTADKDVILTPHLETPLHTPIKFIADPHSHSSTVTRGTRSYSRPSLSRHLRRRHAGTSCPSPRAPPPTECKWHCPSSGLLFRSITGSPS